MKKRCHIPRNSILKSIQPYFRMLCATSDIYHYAWDMSEDIVMVSPGMVRDFGLPAEVFHTMEDEWMARIHPDDYEGYVKANRKSNFTPDNCIYDYSYRVRDIKDNYVWLRCRGQITFNSEGKPELWAGTMSRLGYQAQADPNTGLLSKAQFERAVRSALDKTENESPQGMMVILGIDNFKLVNESFNRRVGDILLRIAADSIEKIMPKGIILYKLDGDEFGVIIPEIDENKAKELYEAAQKSFCRPHLIEGRNVFCTISAGAVAYMRFGKDYQVLFKHAESALAQAKREGKNKLVVFTKVQYNRWLRSLNMRDTQRKCIENNFEGFSLFYQPQVNARTRRITGVEALVRWYNPDTKRMVAPMEFIPVLEETKMIIPVGRWIFEQAVIQCNKWQKKWSGLRMSINISYEQIKESGFQEFVLECLHKHNVAPYLITLELTETAIVSDWKNLNSQFAELRKNGISIAMDDFGTGYSSLAYLKNLACDIVKIDRTFVTHVTKENASFERQLIKSTVELCHSVNISCYMEGVETAKQFEYLRDFCQADNIQGYFFGHPESPDVFEKKFANGFQGSYVDIF